MRIFWNMNFDGGRLALGAHKTIKAEFRLCAMCKPYAVQDLSALYCCLCLRNGQCFQSCLSLYVFFASGRGERNLSTEKVSVLCATLLYVVCMSAVSELRICPRVSNCHRIKLRSCLTDCGKV